jgi:hypothetical protein
MKSLIANPNELIKEKLDLCIKKAYVDLYLNDYELIKKHAIKLLTKNEF